MVMEEQHSDMELAAEKIPVPQVQGSVEMPSLYTNNRIKSISHSKPRFRKKALHAAILKQMEFYFSDANLTKDRFLGSLIKEDPYVDLSVFIRFNKIRELTTDINRIAKALQGSTILALSEDGTKVSRITPIKHKENVQDCTVYVQNLPPDANHDWLCSVFSQYGNVIYVSIPHYRINKKIKGFGFVEFDKPEEANKCLKAFKKMGCVLPIHTSPDELLSITTFDDVEKDVTRRNKMFIEKSSSYLDSGTNYGVNVTDAEMKNGNKEKEHCMPEESVNADKDCNGSRKVMKRKHSSSSEINANTDIENEIIASVSKKPKKKDKHIDQTTSNDIANEHEVVTENVILQESSKMDVKEEKFEEIDELSKKSNKQLETENDNDSKEIPTNNLEKDNVVTEDVEMVNETDNKETAEDGKKKKRKRKRKSRIDEDSIGNIGLQVMSKKDWKFLRNKYLELQKTKMKQLKQHLIKTRNQWSHYDRTKSDKEESGEKEKAPTTEKVPVRSFSFTPGVIVKIELNEPCIDPKSLKMELKGNSSIKYIDVSEGGSEVYVRHDTPESAKSFVQKSNETQNMTILKDEEERIYWKKILQDREEKLGKKIKVKQRGRSKLLKKAEKELGKHIKFDEV